MAEALGLAANIFAVVDITGKVAVQCYEYIGSAKRARKDLKKLIYELHSFIQVLIILQKYVESNSTPSTALGKLNFISGPLKACAKEMRDLQVKLEPPRKGFQGFMDRLKWPLKEGDTLRQIERIERHKALFNLAVSTDQISLSKGIEEVVQRTSDMIGAEFVTQSCWRQKEDARLHLEKRKKALDWLYPGDYNTKHLEISGKRQRDTGDWLLKSVEFQGWFEGKLNSRILWGHGIPGAGKTFLSSLVIDHLPRALPGCGVAHTYFNYMEQESQKPTQVLSSLIKQLVNQTLDFPKGIEEIYDKSREHGIVPSLDELYSILLEVSSLFPRVIIILDALDECHPETQRHTLLPLLRKMGGSYTGISLFLTSRPHPEDIQDSLKDAAKIELSAHEQDIVAYIEEKITENPRARRLAEQAKCKDRIISELVDCAKGMFLLVRFHIEFLYEQTSAREILAALEKLKSSSTGGRPLDNTYHRAIETIRRQHRSSSELAFSILSWLVSAKRSLSVEELRVALALNKGDRELDMLNLRETETLLDVCASLVVHDEHSKTIMLAHYTVQEYLVKNSLVLTDVELHIATTCITYLSLDTFCQAAGAVDFEPDPFLEYPFAAGRVKLRSYPFSDYPFLEYASSHVEAHLKACNENLTTDLLLEFLGGPYDNIEFFARTQTLWLGFLGGSPLHIACAFGHLKVTQILINRGADISSVNYWGQTPLYQAANGEVAQLLLEKGADISTSDVWGDTPLHSAAGRHEAVAQLLIEKGANPSAKNTGRVTPLFRAIATGQETIVQLLLKYTIENTDIENGVLSALFYAVGTAHTRVVKILLDGGVGVTSGGSYVEGFLEGLLLIAADRGLEAIVSLLLEKGAEILARNHLGLTALDLAASKGHEATIRLLLSKGAKVSAVGNQGETLLHSTAEQGNKAVFQILLNTIEGSELTLPHESVVRGDEAKIWLLFQLGIDIPVTDKRGRKPMHEAPLLLSNGTVVLAIDHRGRTPLHDAAFRGDEAMILMLLERGAVITAIDEEGRTPLHEAVRVGSMGAVIILLEGGADISSVDKWGRTPFHVAIAKGREEVAQVLLEKGADVLSRDNDGRTPLHTACILNIGFIVSYLLRLGADVSALDNEGRTPLHEAISRDLEVTRMLLWEGAKFSSVDKKGLTPLYEAALVCSYKMILILLEEGADLSGIRLDSLNQERLDTMLESIRRKGLNNITVF